MIHPRITELFPNPKGTDKGNEWIELCSTESTDLSFYALRIGTRSLPLSGKLTGRSCAIARTGTASLRNREATVSLLYNNTKVQSVHAAGTAPEGYGFQVGHQSFWAPATPGVNATSSLYIPPLPDLRPPSRLPELVGTAACTAGILTALALTALRYARDRHYALPRRNTADRC